MMGDVVARQEALEAVAARLQEVAPSAWMQMYAAFETHGDPSVTDSEMTWVTLGAVNLGDQWGFGQLDQDPQVYDLVQQFRGLCEPPWTRCEIKVDYTGSFDTELGYDGSAPEGTFSPELMDRLQSYNAAFTNEWGPAPHAGKG